MSITSLVISCEHGGNDIPESYQALFSSSQEILTSHQAYDFGAFEIAQALVESTNCDFNYTTTSRLLIDCNRSLTHSRCFSSHTRSLSDSEKKVLIEQYYRPYREITENQILTHINLGQQVLHLSIHSFTPVLNNKPRTAAIGLLYDSSRHGEKEVCRLWASLLMQHPPKYRVRLNYPYRGSSDGFTTHLRKKYPEKNYLGIELEVNQALLQTKASLEETKNVFIDSLNSLLQLL